VIKGVETHTRANNTLCPLEERRVSARTILEIKIMQ
jgi:hypothetical protein